MGLPFLRRFYKGEKMDYKRNMIVLKNKSGESRLLLLERRFGQRFSLDLRENEQLFVFTGEEEFFPLQQDFEKPRVEDICAACIRQDERITFFGANRTFAEEEALLYLQHETEKPETLMPKHIEIPEETIIETPNTAAAFHFADESPRLPYIPARLFNSMNEIQPQPDCPIVPKIAALNPFPRQFPFSEWRKVSFSIAGWHYLTGEIYENGEISAKAVAVPGEYAPMPPGNLPEFSRFCAGELGGYWVYIEKQE